MKPYKPVDQSVSNEDNVLFSFVNTIRRIGLDLIV